MFEKIPSQESIDISKFEALVDNPRPVSALTRKLVDDTIEGWVSEENGQSS